MRSRRHLTILGLLLLKGLLAAEAPSPHRDGTLEDLRRLDAETDLIRGSVATPVTLDAEALPSTEFASARSRPIRLRPDTRYTLAVRFRTGTKGMLTAGIQWVDPDRPAGLAEADDLRAAFTEADADSWCVLTFRSDPEFNAVRILLKAWGGTTCTVETITLVEGWYAD